MGGGALPEDIMKQWKNSSEYFSPEGKILAKNYGKSAEGEPIIAEEKTLEKRFDAAALDLDEEEATAVKALIRKILQYDPTKRPTTSEILQDPWFRGIDDAGNYTA
ncbi:hypothetical protein SEPCBS119000_002908 [Sporothrix epigloea]|uniref:Protein kinase domain-containing protein n=1 Tax=Sporothrix epigloea TaxID=1892477 RepID=A0ABP0DKI2_9PEZI